MSLSHVLSSSFIAPATLLHGDSTAAVQVVKVHQLLRTRHLTLRAACVRSLVLSSALDFKHVSTNKQLADSLTKCARKSEVPRAKGLHWAFSLSTTASTTPRRRQGNVKQNRTGLRTLRYGMCGYVRRPPRGNFENHHAYGCQRN